jgi:hypothetical protein
MVGVEVATDHNAFNGRYSLDDYILDTGGSLGEVGTWLTISSSAWKLRLSALRAELASGIAVLQLPRSSIHERVFSSVSLAYEIKT